MVTATDKRVTNKITTGLVKMIEKDRDFGIVWLALDQHRQTSFKVAMADIIMKAIEGKADESPA